MNPLYKYTPEEIDQEIQKSQPSTKAELEFVLRVLCVEKYKIKQVWYYGTMQGVKVIIDGKKLPLKRGNVYSIFA